MIMPLIALFGGDNIIGPALIPVSQMSPSQIWSNYVRYIGAGAVAAGGIYECGNGAGEQKTSG